MKTYEIVEDEVLVVAVLVSDVMATAMLSLEDENIGYMMTDHVLVPKKVNDEMHVILYWNSSTATYLSVVMSFLQSREEKYLWLKKTRERTLFLLVRS